MKSLAVLRKTKSLIKTIENSGKYIKRTRNGIKYKITLKLPNKINKSE